MPRLTAWLLLVRSVVVPGKAGVGAAGAAARGTQAISSPQIVITKTAQIAAAAGAGRGVSARAVTHFRRSAVPAASGGHRGRQRLVHFTEFYGSPAPPGFESITVPYVPPVADGLRFIARNIIDGQAVDWDLPLIKPQISYALSGPTLIKATIEPEQQAIVEEHLDAWATWLDVELDGQIRASGIVQPIAVDGDQLSVETIGVSGYPHGMPYLAELSEIGVDALDVVRAIWTHLLSYPDAGPLRVTLSDNRSGVLLGTPEHTEVDAEGKEQTVKAAPYELNWWTDVDCGSEIDSLAKATPFDYVESSGWNADRSAVDHHIELSHPRAGRLRDDLRFALDENLLAAFVVREDPDGYASQVIVRGKGEGRDGIRGSAGSQHPTRLRRIAMVTDKNIADGSRADSVAATELRSRGVVITIGEIVVSDSHPNAPIGSYAVGDDIIVAAPLSYLGEIRAAHRITGYTWSPDEGTVTLQLARSDVFAYGTPVDPPVEPSTADTASERYGWGVPVLEDAFDDYTGTPRAYAWRLPLPGSVGLSEFGWLQPYQTTVVQTGGVGAMILTGAPNGDTPWVQQNTALRYGRWEIRLRVQAPAGVGASYLPNVYLWPITDNFPADGQYELLRAPVGSSTIEARLHYPNHTPQPYESATRSLDATAWHNYAFEWTPEWIRGYVDGEQWYSYSGVITEAPHPMSLTIELLHPGTAPQRTEVQVDFVRAYAIPRITQHA